MIKNFVYNDIVLYAKGWYQSKDGDIIKDLGYLFSKIYAYTARTEYEVARYMLRVLDSLYTEKKIAFNGESLYSYTGFFNRIEMDSIVYKVSFDMAIILYVKSVLFDLKNDEIILNPPHYGKKEYFRLGNPFGRNPISMTYKEMNRIVDKRFKKIYET